MLKIQIQQVNNHKSSNIKPNYQKLTGNDYYPNKLSTIEESKTDIDRPADISGNYQILDRQVSEIGMNQYDDDFNSERADSEILEKDRDGIQKLNNRD